MGSQHWTREKVGNMKGIPLYFLLVLMVSIQARYATAQDGSSDMYDLRGLGKRSDLYGYRMNGKRNIYDDRMFGKRNIYDDYRMNGKRNMYEDYRMNGKRNIYDDRMNGKRNIYDDRMFGKRNI